MRVKERPVIILRFKSLVIECGEKKSKSNGLKWRNKFELIMCGWDTGEKKLKVELPREIGSCRNHFPLIMGCYGIFFYMDCLPLEP